MDDLFDGYLLVSDMDATLLSDDHTISAENREAIEYFTGHGGKFTVATGRMVSAVRAYLPDIPINAPAVLHNGAKVFDFQTGNTIFEKFIEEPRKTVFPKVSEQMPELGIEVYSDETVYIYKPCGETERFKTKKYDVVYRLPEHVWERPWIKVLLIGERDLLDAYEKVYRAEYDRGNAVRSGANYLDIVANGVSKGNGVEQVARTYGIDRNRVITVGDNMNDISMIDFAGESWCVENAEEALRERAHNIAPDNNHHALAYIVEQLKEKIKKNI